VKELTWKAMRQAEARASLESRENALKARQDELAARERGLIDKERKLEKAKSEYHVLYAELKKRKKVSMTERLRICSQIERATDEGVRGR
jgi:peptidoglycan hydrolase CwlO-like protein